MAFSASGRFSSEYHTASSFDPQNEALHSTIAFNENTEGSADMSIELGRGVKRAPREEELSEDGIFTFGSDQQYEITGTPPLRSRNASGRKTDGALRRDATVRKASEAAKANESVRRSASLGGKKQASLADALIRNNEHTIDDTMQATTTIPSRNTRFTRFTNPSTNNGARVLSGSTLEGSNPENRDPSRFKVTQRDATFQGTEESFVIPEMDGATALFAATPSMPRSAKRGSRFTPSASYRMPSRGTEPAHAPLDGVPIPEDARQVYESLQKAVAKIEELEAQRAESNRAADEYEVQITELRAQLEIEQRMRRPDSGLGSEEEGAKEKWRREHAQLQTRVKSLQGRLTQSERQTSIQEAAVDRITSERDDFAVQFEDTAAVNDQLREKLASLQQENEDLQNELAFLKGESGGSKVRTSKAKRPDRTQELSTKAMENLTLELQGKKQKKSSSRQRQSTTGVPETMAEVQSGDLTFSQLDEEARDSIARLIQRELQRIQGTAKENSQALPQRQTSTRRSETTRPRSSLDAQVRRNNEHTMLSSRSNRRVASAPVESDASEAESEGEAELTSRTRGTLRDMTLPSGRQQIHEDDTADLTNLSKASFSASDLRKALEEQRRSNRAKRHSSAPLETGHGYDLPQKAATSGARRKSSLKDITAGLELDATGRLTIRGDNDTQRVPKMVRVQSPHTSDGTINVTQKENDSEDVDASVLSNTSHRRRRTAGATDEEHEEGETSAFIIPDITIHTSAPGTKTFTTPNHATNACTVCAEANGKHVDIPMPIPVSTRELGEDATLRPAWEPHVSLAHVLKQLQDEVVHLKLQLAKKEAEYNAHDPAVGRRRRQSVLDEMQKLTAEVERRSEMVYRLYDVVEGQKNNFKAADENRTSASVGQNETTEQEVEETLQSIGMDPAEVAGRVGRSAPDVPEGLQEEYSGDESDELPWEGLSDTE